MSTDHDKAKEIANDLINGDYFTEWKNLAACYLGLVKQHGELREALEFYGDGNNWVCENSCHHEKISSIDLNHLDTNGTPFSTYTKHGGKRARETLARIPKQYDRIGRVE